MSFVVHVRLHPSERSCIAREYIADLPAEEPPDLFGLHGNAALARSLGEARHLLTTLAAMQPRATGLPGGTAGDLALMEQVWSCNSTFFPCRAILRRSYPYCSRLLVYAQHCRKSSTIISKVRVGGVMRQQIHLHWCWRKNSSGLTPLHSPRWTLGAQTWSSQGWWGVHRYQRLGAAVRGSLMELERALGGRAAMSTDLEQMCASLAANQVFSCAIGHPCNSL